MKRLLILIFAIACCRSFAYYDDVHYALTYYVARQSGFSPEQSFRIASACSSVDWDEHTEPVQQHGQVALLGDRGEGLIDFAEFGLKSVPSAILKRVTGGALSQFFVGGMTIKEMRETATNARFRFHAFRDELKHDDVVGNGIDGIIAQGDVRRQLEMLFDQAPTTGNIGVYLHGFEDVQPHFGYGTTWGHNPFPQDSFNLHLQRGLPIGSATDWISFRRHDVVELCRTVNKKLTDFMQSASPHQYWRPHYFQEYDSLVNRLAALNPFPKPIKTDLQRQIFIRYYARSKGVDIGKIDGSLVNHEELAKVAADLGVGLSMEDLRKHKDGPDVHKAIEAVNNALKDAGMTDEIPPHHYQYDLDEQGRLANPEQLDNWVLVGDLVFKTRGAPEPVTATLKLTVRDATGKPKLQDVPGIPPVELQPGVEHTWPKLPIGEVYVNLKKRDGSTQRFRCRLTKQRNLFSAAITAGKVNDDSETKSDAEKKPPTPGIADFTGQWHSMVGRIGYKHDLTMSQSADEVTGSWKHAGGSGTLKGTVKGRTLTFTWESGGDKGTGSFRMRSDNKSFTGEYSSEAKDGVKNNPWSGHKL